MVRRLLTPAEAARRAAAVETRGRLSPQLVVLIVLSCLCAGFLVGTSSTLALPNTRRTRHDVAVGDLVWRGSRPNLLKKRACEDSCTGFTRNGVCDEGRPTLPYRSLRREQDAANAVYDVHCDLGTDCGDCGTWYHTNAHDTDHWRPVQDLRKMDPNFRLQTRLSATPQRFWLAFSAAERDTGVSAYMHEHLLFEHGHTWLWHNLLRECVVPHHDANDASSRQLVADVGANFGYYSLLAAAMGCRVVAWEPVPYFAAYFKYALLRNNMTHAVQLRDTIAGSEAGNLTMMAALEQDWGSASVGGANIAPELREEGDHLVLNVTKPVERVDAAVAENVLVLKVDVEGHEPSVLRSAKQLLLQHEVKHILLDYTPGAAEKREDWNGAEAHPAMLAGLLRGGYTILRVPHEFRNATPDWERKRDLPHMEEVTLEVLQYDIADTQHMWAGTLGCPLPAELQGRTPGLYECGTIPQGLDPHSLRATFEHSVNLWAFKMQPWFANIGPPASLVPLDFDIQHQYFVQGGEVGMGGRRCLELLPEDQVSHRCPCTAKDECGELERLVTDLAAQGKLPPFPLEGNRSAAAGFRIEEW